MNINEFRQAMQTDKPVPPQGFGSRSDILLARLAAEEETKVKKKLSLGLVLAIALIVLTLTGLAAGLGGLNIRDYIRRFEEGEISESFESGFRQEVTAEINGVCFRVVDAYATPSRAVILTEISMKDKSPALFCYYGDDPAEAPLRYLEPVSVKEYADSHQLPIIPVSVFVDEDNNLCSGGTFGVYAVDDYHAVYFYTMNYETQAGTEIDPKWEACVYPGFYCDLNTTRGAKSEEKAFSLIASEEIYDTVYVDKTVSSPFGPVTLDLVKTRRNPLETAISFRYHFATLTPSQINEIRDSAYGFVPIDPETRLSVRTVFSGSELGCFVDEDGSVVFFYEQSFNLPPDTDVIYLQFLPDEAVPVYQPNPEEQRKTEVLAVAINEPYESWFAPKWFPDEE